MSWSKSGRKNDADFWAWTPYDVNGFPFRGGPGTAPFRPSPLLWSHHHQGLHRLGPGVRTLWTNNNIMNWMRGHPADPSEYELVLNNYLGIKFGGSGFGSSSEPYSGSGTSGVYGW